MGFARIGIAEEDRRSFNRDISALSETISIRNRELKESRDYNIQKTSEIGWLHTQKQELERKLLIQDEMIGFVKEQLREATLERKQVTDNVFRFLGVIREPELEITGEAANKDMRPLVHSRTRANIKRQLELRAENLLKDQRKREDAAVTRGELEPEEVKQ